MIAIKKLVETLFSYIIISIEFTTKKVAAQVIQLILVSIQDYYIADAFFADLFRSQKTGHKHITSKILLNLYHSTIMR